MEPIVYIVIGALACLGLLHLVQQAGPRRQRDYTDADLLVRMVRMLVEAEGAPRVQPAQRGRRRRERREPWK